jgi:hypothetical protein
MPRKLVAIAELGSGSEAAPHEVGLNTGQIGSFRPFCAIRDRRHMSCFKNRWIASREERETHPAHVAGAAPAPRHRPYRCLSRSRGRGLILLDSTVFEP